LFARVSVVVVKDHLPARIGIFLKPPPRLFDPSAFIWDVRFDDFPEGENHPAPRGRFPGNQSLFCLPELSRMVNQLAIDLPGRDLEMQKLMAQNVLKH
jgi:hypothetical protein